jgi:hypothetical protein
MTLPPLQLSGGANTSGSDMRGASFSLGAGDWNVDMGYSNPPMLGGYNSPTSVNSLGSNLGLGNTSPLVWALSLGVVFLLARR